MRCEGRRKRAQRQTDVGHLHRFGLKRAKAQHFPGDFVEDSLGREEKS